MRALPHEVLQVVFLDNTHAIIAVEVVAEGTVNVNAIYPRELVKTALRYNASALILAHNHPSGSLQPSQQDERLTRTLFLLCSFMHISLLDHLIVGAGEQVFSFADQGLMRHIQDQCKKMTAALD